jgi:hypothetical protein
MLTVSPVAASDQVTSDEPGWAGAVCCAAALLTSRQKTGDAIRLDVLNNKQVRKALLAITSSESLFHNGREARSWRIVALLYVVGRASCLTGQVREGFDRGCL